MTAQEGLARVVAEIACAGAEGPTCHALANCLIDFSAAVLAGARTGLSGRIAARYCEAGTVGSAFTLSYLAEISEFSHGHNRSAGHVGSTVMPAVLAYARVPQQPDVVFSRAALAGYEAFGRVGRSLMPALERWGSISTGFSGSLGAAAASAVVQGLDADGICSALGIAGYLTPLTPVEGYLSGANSAEAAMATEIGMRAAELAQAGVPGSPRVLDDLHARITGREPDPAFADRSPMPLAVQEVYFKPYPCCRFTHGAIEAALAAYGPAADCGEIAAVEIAVPPRANAMCGALPVAPVSGYLARQFSIPYLAAVALLAGRVTPAEIFDPPPGLSEQALALAVERFRVVSSDELARLGNVCPTVLTLRMHDGSERRHEALLPWGCPQAPMQRADLLDKLAAAAHWCGLDRSAAGRIRDAAAGLAWHELSCLLGETVNHIAEGVPAL